MTQLQPKRKKVRPMPPGSSKQQENPVPRSTILQNIKLEAKCKKASLNLLTSTCFYQNIFQAQLSRTNFLKAVLCVMSSASRQ